MTEVVGSTEDYAKHCREAALKESQRLAEFESDSREETAGRIGDLSMQELAEINTTTLDTYRD